MSNTTHLQSDGVTNRDKIYDFVLTICILANYFEIFVTTFGRYANNNIDFLEYLSKEHH